MKSTLVIVDAGKQIPEDFRTLLLEKHKVGFAYATGNQEDAVESDSTTEELKDNLETVDGAFKDDAIVYQFFDGDPKEFDKSQHSPFIILQQTKGEGETAVTKDQLVVFVAGTFPKYAEIDDGSPDKAFVEDHICGIVGAMQDVVGDEDITLLMNALDKKPQHDKIQKELGKDSSVLFVPYKGLSVGIHNLESYPSIADGVYVSDTLGYGAEKKSEPTATDNTKKPTLKIKGAAKPAEASAPNAGTKENLNELYKDLLSSTSKGVAWEIKGKDLICMPPPGYSMKDAREFWNKHCTMPIPKNPLAYGGFPADALKTNSPFYAMRQKALGITTPKTADHEQAPTEPLPDQKQDKKEVTLHLNADVKKAYHKLKSEGLLPLATEEELQDYVNRYPFVDLQLGEQLSEIMMLHPMAYIRLPHAALAWLCHRHRCNELGLTPQKAEDQPTIPAETKPTEEPKPTEAPATGKPRVTLKVKKVA